MKKRLYGFDRMTPERRREVAAKGGRKAQASGLAHRWDSAEAREAGRLGGEASVRARRTAAGDLG